MTAIRVGIAVLLAFAVLAHGATEVWSQSVLEIGVAALFLLWGILTVRRRPPDFRWHALQGPLLGFAGFVLVQLAFGLSVYPYLTKVEFLKLAAYFFLFFLAGQSLRSAEELERFVWFLLIFGFVVALFGIIQFFTFTGKLYWFREIRYGSPFGPYVNRNHFAGLMELITPLGLALFFLRAARTDKLPLVALFTLIPIGALFLSASRGGILIFLIQFGLLAYLVWARPAGRKRLALVTAVILLAGSFVVWLGVGQTLERITQSWSEGLSHERRAVILRDSWRILLDHPWTGTGLGTLVTVYPQYESFYDGFVVDHAHNDYLELLVETGVIGGLCGLAFLVLLFRSALASLNRDAQRVVLAVRTGALVACAGILLHGLVDFNLHIPANAMLFFLQASLATADVPSTRTASLP